MPVKRVVMTRKAARCVLEVPVAKKGLNITDLSPSFKADCSGEDAVVSGVRGDTVITQRVHVLRVATRGMEDEALEGLLGVFRDKGVDHAIVTTSPSSLKGVKAFFSKLRGQVCAFSIQPKNFQRTQSFGGFFVQLGDVFF